MSDSTKRQTGKLPDESPVSKMGGEEGQTIKFASQEHRDYFQAIRQLHQLLTPRSGEADNLRRQVATLSGLVCRFRDSMNDILTQLLGLSQQVERSLDRDRKFWERFGEQLFRVLVPQEDRAHVTLIELAKQYEALVEARKSGESEGYVRLFIEDVQNTLKQYREVVTRFDEAAFEDDTPAKSAEEAPGEHASPNKATMEKPNPPPADPIEQSPVVEAWRLLEHTASHVADACRVHWSTAAYELDLVSQTVKHLEQKLHEDRGLDAEVRGKNLAVAAEGRSNNLIGTLCKLDVLISGRNERGEPQRQPEGPLREAVKTVRNLLFDFVREFGGWCEVPVSKGQSYLLYKGKLDVVGSPPANQQTIKEVLHPGYSKEGGSESTRKPRVILS